MNDMWKKIDSKILFSNPRLTVEEDNVELPSGKRVGYLKYGYKGNGVVVICQNERDEILFQKEYSYIPNQKILQFPMGLIENSEGIENAAKRELLEETGLITSNLKLIGQYFQNHRRSENIAYVFLAKELTNSQSKLEDEEDIQTLWIPKGKISEKISKGEIMDADTLSSLSFLGIGL